VKRVHENEAAGEKFTYVQISSTAKVSGNHCDDYD
jgi:hypothetical protein